MFNNVRVNYPKRKHKVRDSKVYGIEEPVRKTMYDVVVENFKIAERNTFLHRIIYTGEHFHSKGDYSIAEAFQKIIAQVNESYCMEKLTGFLLYYSKHFIHVVEGDEDSINKHIGLLLENNEVNKSLGTMKLLIHLSHINQRFISDWNYYNGTPSKLLGHIDVNSSLEDTGRQIYICIKKVYNLVSSFVDDNYAREFRPTAVSIYGESLENTSEVFPLKVRSEVPSSGAASLQSTMSFRSICPTPGRDPYRSYLPEIEVLDFILKSPFTQHLSEYFAVYGVVPQRDIYKDKVWPVPSDFVPYDVFGKPYETFTKLPKGTNEVETSTEKEVEPQETEKDNKNVGAQTQSNETRTEKEVESQEAEKYNKNVGSETKSSETRTEKEAESQEAEKDNKNVGAETKSSETRTEKEVESQEAEKDNKNVGAETKSNDADTENVKADEKLNF